MKTNTYNTTKNPNVKVSKTVGIVLFFLLMIPVSYASSLSNSSTISPTIHKQQIKFVKGQITTNVRGKILPKDNGNNETAHNYTFDGEKGQYMVINLSAHPKKNELELANIGVVTSPSGLMEGTKGGIIYQKCLPETGEYTLRIARNIMAGKGDIAGYQAELVILPQYTSDKLCN